MKSLIFSVDYPLPEDKGSKMRTMHFVRFFQQCGDVDLMCYKSHAPAQPVGSPFRNHYHIDMTQAPTRGSVLQSLREKLIDQKPWMVQSFSAETVQYIHRVIVEQDYDVILCRYSVNAYPLLSLPQKYKDRVILDIDDVMNCDLYDVMNGKKKGWAKFKAVVDKMVLRKYQVKCLQLGKVVFCSEADRIQMSRRAKTDNLFVVPNIIPKQEIPPTFKRERYGNKWLLFVGTLSYPPNETGILWFIQEIFQKLPTEYQDLRLLIVGKAPRDILKEICVRNSKIELVENPPDVLPYLEKCWAVIVPVLTGGGTRIKILEAGNCSRPVLTTRLGAHGLDLEGRQEVLYFSDRGTFVDCLEWLKDDGHYRGLVASLGHTVETRYSEASFINALQRCSNISPPGAGVLPTDK